MSETEKIRGTLIRGIGSFYTARDNQGVSYTLRCKKKFRHQRMSPMVGDEVIFVPGRNEEHGWIEEILPRKTVCLRPPVANVTRLVVVIAPVPEPDLLLTDRLISRAVAQGMDVIIVISKTDIDPGLPERIRQEYKQTGFPVVSVSALNRTGLDELRDQMKGPVCCMTGQSGVGKSTILNALMDLKLETGNISRKIERGKNTTRMCELIEKNGLRVMDTAGFSLLEPERNLEPEKLKERYPEFLPYEGKCRFRECLHDKEPGCAVSEAVKLNLLSRPRVERYRQLLSETREVWRARYD